MTTSYQSDLSFKRAVNNLQLKLSALRLSFQLTRHAYDPNQPRVPAGNPDGGQWTDAGGASGASGSSSGKISIGSNTSDSIFNDEAREEVAGGGKRLSNANSPIIGSYSLVEDEGGFGRQNKLRGHAIKKHVGNSRRSMEKRINVERAAYLSGSKFFKLAAKYGSRFKIPHSGKLKHVGAGIERLARNKVFRVSAFKDVDAADYFVQSVFNENEKKIHLFIADELPSWQLDLFGRLILKKRFKQKTGIYALAKGFGKPKLYDTY